MSYYTPLLGSIPLTLDEIAFIQNLSFEAGYDSSVISITESGTSAPSSTPSSLGDIYVNTSTNQIYISTGTSSVADWNLLGGGSSLTIQEEDGTPTGIFTTLKVTNGTLIDNGDGSASLNIPPPGGGEANTASNLGDGEGVFASKSGVDLRFKSLVEGTNISITSDANEVTINSTATAYTNENAQDAVGTILTDTTSIDLIYDDAGNTISAQREALTGAITASKNSNTTLLGSFTKAQLDTAVSDGDVLYVGDITGNATHTGEVTGSGALTVDKTAITNKNTVTPVAGDFVLVSDASDSDNLKKVNASEFLGGGGDTFINTIYRDSSDASDAYGTLAGAVNGTNTTFTVSTGVYATGTLQVFQRGKLVKNGTGLGWVETDPSTGEFDFVVAPPAEDEDEIFVSYQTEETTSSSLIGEEFETVSKNLKSFNATLNYTGSQLTSIAYSNGVTKTLNYTGSQLTSIVLSGSTPSGIDLTKTLSYTGSNLTGIMYS